MKKGEGVLRALPVLKAPCLGCMALGEVRTTVAAVIVSMSYQVATYREPADLTQLTVKHIPGAKMRMICKHGTYDIKKVDKVTWE